MREELENQLQNDYLFMWQKNEEGQDLYRRWNKHPFFPKDEDEDEYGIYRIQTLCDDCHQKRIKRVQEQRERRRNMSIKERLAEIKEYLE